MTPILWVMKNTIMRTLRMKATYICFVLVSLLLFVMPHTLISDGTVHGEVKIFLVWTMGGLLFMLCSYNLIAIVTQIREDIDEKQILIIDSTPLPRWAYIIGRLMGLITLNAIYLLLALSVIYFSINFKKNKLEAKYKQALKVLEEEGENEEAIETIKSYQVLINDVLSARDKYMDYYNVRELTEKALTRLKEGGRLDKTESEYRKQFSKFYAGQKIFSAPAMSICIRPVIFHGIPKASEDTMYYTFSYHLTSSQKVSARIKGIWLMYVEDQNGKRILAEKFPINHKSGVVKSIRFTTKALTYSDKIYFAYENHDKKSAYGGIKSPFHILIPSSSFELNLLKAGTLILMKVFMVTALGCFLSVFLSFPVSIFLGFNFIIFSYTQAILAKSIRLFKPLGNTTSSDHASYVNTSKAWWSEILVKVFPKLDNYVGELLVNGQNITTGLFVEEFIFTILVRAGAFFGLAVFLIYSIELASQNTNELVKR